MGVNTEAILDSVAACWGISIAIEEDVVESTHSDESAAIVTEGETRRGGAVVAGLENTNLARIQP